MVGHIYSIKCDGDNMSYIGSTKNTPRKRFKNHLYELRKNIHRNRHLQNAFNKYGESSLGFEVLFSVEVETRECLFIIEDEIIAKTPNLFNTVKRSGAPAIFSDLTPDQQAQKVLAIKLANTGRRWTQEQLDNFKLRPKRVWTEASKAKLSASATGRRWSDEEKEMLSEAHKGKVLSEEHRLNIVKNNGKVKHKGLVLIDPNGIEYVLDTGVPTFAKKHDLPRSSIQSLIEGKCKQTKGWKLKLAHSK